jgi:hypothetical protein
MVIPGPTRVFNERMARDPPGAKVVGQAVGEWIHSDLSAAGRDTVQHRT